MNEYLNFRFRVFEVIPTSSTCIHMFIICVSSTCFIYFIFVCLWHCECVHIWHEFILNISKCIQSNFETHFRMLRHVEKPWQRRNTNFLWCNIYFDFIATMFFILVKIIENCWLVCHFGWDDPKLVFVTQATWYVMTFCSFIKFTV